MKKVSLKICGITNSQSIKMAYKNKSSYLLELLGFDAISSVETKESLINIGIILTYLMVGFAALTAIGFGIKKMIANH